MQTVGFLNDLTTNVCGTSILPKIALSIHTGRPPPHVIRRPFLSFETKESVLPKELMLPEFDCKEPRLLTSEQLFGILKAHLLWKLPPQPVNDTRKLLDHFNTKKQIRKHGDVIKLLTNLHISILDAPNQITFHHNNHRNLVNGMNVQQAYVAELLSHHEVLELKKTSYLAGCHFFNKSKFYNTQ